MEDFLEEAAQELLGELFGYGAGGNPRVGKGGWSNGGFSYNKAANSVPAEQKIWIGGLPTDITWQTLEKHVTAVAGNKPKYTVILGRKGEGCCTFHSAEDAMSALGNLSGSTYGGSALKVEPWRSKDTAAGASNPKQNIASIDASMKVWVGNMNKRTDSEGLRKHLVNFGLGEHIDVVSVLPWQAGKGCVAFISQDAVAAAISAVNGTTLDDSVIQVDVWTEREDKPAWKKPRTLY